MSQQLTRLNIKDLTPNKNYITPDYTKPYNPLEYSIQFFNWRNIMLGAEEVDTPKTHYQLIDFFTAVHGDVQALCHRGFGKSTLVTKYLPLYIASTGELPNFGMVQNMVIFSATYKQAVEMLQSIKTKWETSTRLQSVLKLAKNMSGRPVAYKEDYVCWEMPNGEWFHLQAKGAGDSLRGTTKPSRHGKDIRLEVLVFDDILRDLALTSEPERERIVKWFFGAITPAVSKKKNKRFVIGTPMVESDILNIIKEGETFKTITFPVAQEFPVPVEKIISAWQEWHTPKQIMKDFVEMKEAGEEDIFYREFMLEISSRAMRVFKNNWIVDYKFRDKIKDSVTWNFYTSMDLAVSTKASGDKTVIMTIGVDPKGNRWIVKTSIGSMSPREAIDELFRHVSKFGPKEVRAEKAALQQVLNEFIEEEMKHRGIYFRLEPLLNNTNISKDHRIFSLQPLFQQKKIHFPIDIDKENTAELKKQIKGFIKTGPTTRWIDALDCLANFNDPDFVWTPRHEHEPEIVQSLSQMTEFKDPYSWS